MAGRPLLYPVRFGPHSLRLRIVPGDCGASSVPEMRGWRGHPQHQLKSRQLNPFLRRVPDMHPPKLGNIMSALGQKQTCAAQSPCPPRAKSGHCILFDNVVGASKHCQWNGKALRLCSFNIDDQLVLRRRLYRKIGGPLAF